MNTPPHHTPQSPLAPQFYVPIPRQLMDDARGVPATIGVYVLIARLYRAVQTPIPLSPADLAAYDPALSPTAALRALQRLVVGGYLVAERRRGQKNRYTPAWGQIRDQPRPWNLAAPRLGCPDHLEFGRLEQRLLDTCIGRLRPHPTFPAQVERYLAQPLLSLADVGAYALAQAGLPAASPTLDRLGLLAGGRPRPLPDDLTILAVASQHSPEAITDAGWRRTPWPEAAPVPTPSGAPLFLVPRDRAPRPIADPIMHPITLIECGDAANSASQRDCAAQRQQPQCGHVYMYQDEHDPSTTPGSKQPGSGGGGGGPIISTPATPVQVRRERGRIVRSGASHAATLTVQPQPSCDPVAQPDDGNAAVTLPATESARQLRALGVRADVVRQLADRPVEQVARVIAQARARNDVRDRAAWVVSALRALPAEEPPPEDLRPVSARPIHFHPHLDADQRSRWLLRFRRAETPAEQRAVLARLEQEHPLHGMETSR